MFFKTQNSKNPENIKLTKKVREERVLLKSLVDYQK